MAQTKMASENYEFIIEKISSNQPSLDPQQPSSSLHTSLYHILNHFYLVKELPTTADQHIRTRDELDREKREKLFSLLEWEASGKNRDFYSLLFTPPDPNDDSKDGDGVAINAPCGYIFKAQDAVYRCIDCGLDETCVMCARCFKASDHQSHNTSVRYSTGTGGGCCDCGDKEAWKVPCTCKIHCGSPPPPKSSSSTTTSTPLTTIPEPLPIHLQTSLGQTISTCLDFISSCFAQIPRSQKTPEDISSIIQDPSSSTYLCLLWNDEHHSFSEVIDQLKDSIICSSDQARVFAELIDQHGRWPVYATSSNNIPLILQIARKLARIGLVATVQPSASFLREQVAIEVLEWIANLAACVATNTKSRATIASTTTSNTSMDGKVLAPVEPQIRAIVCRELMKNIASSSALVGDGNELENAASTVADSILLANERLWKGPRDTLKQLFIGSLLIESDDSKKWFGRQFAKHYLEIVRQTLAEPTASSKSYEFSTQSLAVQVFTVPTLSNMLLHHTSLFSNICLLLKSMCMEDRYTFLPNQEPMSIMEHYYDAIVFARKTRAIRYLPYDCEMENVLLNKNMVIWNDLWHLVAANAFLPLAGDFFAMVCGRGVEDGRLYKEPPSANLVGFLDLILFVQGMHLQKRAISVHVEYENDAWVGPVSTSMKVLELIETVAETYFAVCAVASDVSKLFYFIDKVFGCLVEWSLLDHMEFCDDLVVDDDKTDGAYSGFHFITFFQDTEAVRIVDRRIAFQNVSMHHAMHWLLSGLLSAIPRLYKDMANAAVIETALEKLWARSDFSRIYQEMGVVDPLSPTVEAWKNGISSKEKLLLMFDYPLQAISFLSQVHSNVWVRNGRSIRLQFSHFKENLLRGAYDFDIFLVQVASMVVGGDLFLASIIDRFHLVHFFKGKVVEGQRALNDPFSRDREIALVEDFLHILIILLSDRSVLAGQTGSEKLRCEMVHCLAAAPNGLAYSVLYDQVLNSINKLEKRKLEEMMSFDQILSLIATFKYPEGISDSGVYTLNEDLFQTVDPWHISLSRNGRESLEEILKSRFKNLKSTDTVNESRTLNLPSLIPPSKVFADIGSLVHSKTFTHTILIALWETMFPLLDKSGTNAVSEMILGEVVQLILIALFISNNENTLATCSPEENFVHFAVNYTIKAKLPSISESEERPTSLVEVILALIDRANEADIKDQAPRLRYIVRTLEEMGGDHVKTLISGWRDKSKWNFFDIASAVSNAQLQEMEESNEKVKRKMAAKARQAAIKAQFAQAQNTFKANFGDELDEDLEDLMDVDEELKAEAKENAGESSFPPKPCDFPSGSCIVCQEDAKSGSKMYGMLCLLQKSHIQRQVDVLDTENMSRVFAAPPSFDEPFVRAPFLPITTETINSVPSENSASYFGNPRNLNGSRLFKKGIITTSCGHLMHMDCLSTYLASISARQSTQPLRNHPENQEFKEFLCPLCKSLGNAILPILWPSKTEYTNLRGSSVMGSTSEAEIMSSSAKSINGLLKETIPGLLQVPEERASSVNDNVYSAMSATSPTSDSESARLDVVAITYERFLFMNIRMFQSPSDLYFSRCELSLASALQTWDLLAYLVCGLEIASRGVGADSAQASLNLSSVYVLDSVSSVNLSLLRVLSETCLSSLLLKVLKNDSAIKQYVSGILFSIHGADACGGPANLDTDFVLLHKDGFSNLVLVFMALFPRFGIVDMDAAFPWIRLFGFFEVVRTIVSIVEALLLHGHEWLSVSATFSQESISDESIKPLSKLIFVVAANLGAPSILEMINSAASIRLIYHLCYSSLLTFSRRCILLLYARFGMVVPSRKDSEDFSPTLEPESKVQRVDPKAGIDPELERNSKYLCLPSLSGMFSMIDDSSIRTMTAFWCSSLLRKDNAYWSSLKDPVDQQALVKRQRICIDQGVIYELVSLPTRLEVLFEGALQYVCQNCNTVPRDPALCMLCGIFVCCQSMCCSDETRGECNMHMKRCGGSIGIYMSVKKCSIIILSNGNGAFNPPPYLDIHGEVDRGLRRGKPQFLNVKRYAEFRKLWQSHAFPSIVARRLEQVIDSGGWRTL